MFDFAKNTAVAKCREFLKRSNFARLAQIILFDQHRYLLLTPGEHCRQIYEFHYPWMHVELAVRHGNRFRNFLINWLSWIVPVDKSKGTAILCNFYDTRLVKAYCRCHPNKITLVRFHDIFDEDNKHKNIELLKGLKNIKGVSEVISYYLEDARTYGLQYEPNLVNEEALNRYVQGREKYFLFFIGANATDGVDRRDVLEKIRQMIEPFRPGELPNDYLKVIDDIRDAVSYREYVEKLALSRVVIDLIRVKKAEGISYRVFEAMALGKKLITNRSDLKKLRFYHPSRIFITDGSEVCNVDLELFVSTEFKPLNDEEREAIMLNIIGKGRII